MRRRGNSDPADLVLFYYLSIAQVVTFSVELRPGLLLTDCYVSGEKVTIRDNERVQVCIFLLPAPGKT